MNQNLSQLTLRSSISRTALTVLSMGVAFFMMPFLIGKLGDRWYGILTLVQTLTGYYYFVDFGLATAVSRYVTLYTTKADNENTNIIINTSLGIYLGMALVIGLVTAGTTIGAGFFVSDIASLPVVRLLIVIMGLNLALEFPFKAFAGIIGAYMRYDLLTLSHFITLVLSTALTVLLLNAGYGIVSLAIIGLLCSQVSNLFFFGIAKRLFAALKISRTYFSSERVRDLFGYSVWSFIIQLGDQLRFRVDSFVIAWALGAAPITHFAIGANLASYLLTLIFRATNFLTPLFTKYHAEDNQEEIRNKLLFVTKINAILAIFGGGLIILIGRAFIQRWVGPDYLDAYPTLVVLTVSVILEAIQNPCNNVLMAIAKHRFFAIVNVTEGLANLMISLLLVQSLGLLGVALGTLIPLIFSRLFILPIYLDRCVKIGLLRYYSTILTVALITILYLAGVHLVVSGLLNQPHYGKLIALCLGILPLYAALALLIMFNSSERVAVRQAVPAILRS